MRRKDLVRARDSSDALEVSERTIYRDIHDLITSGVPIEGEAGVGYVLKAGFDLPPLMFSEQEIEALVLGARIVESWADAELAERCQQRHRQDRGGHSRPAARTTWPTPRCWRRATTTWSRSSSTWPSCAARLRSQLKVHFRYRDALAEAIGAHRAAAVPRLLRPGLAAVGLVRAARGLPHLPPRPHRGLRGAAGALPRSSPARRCTTSSSAIRPGPANRARSRARRLTE